MNDRLERIQSIMEYWADGESDAIDDLDALCQIAEVLGIEVQARDSVEAPKLCGICIAAGRVYCPPEHSSPEQQSPRVCVHCKHEKDPMANFCVDDDCYCKCIFPESVE